MTNTIKVFLDTEFTGLHKNTTLISLALVTEFDDVFYAEFTDYDKTQVDQWLQDNVITNLLFNKYKIIEEVLYSDFYRIKGSKQLVVSYLNKWLNQLIQVYGINKFEVWSDCLAYDWVLFNDLFGTAFDIPKSIYYIPMDICTVFWMKQIDPDISREEFSGYKYTKEDNKHNALTDAKIIKACYEKLFPLCNISDKYKLGGTSKLGIRVKPLE